MKKFKVTWYEGCISEDINECIDNVICTMEVGAESIDNVKALDILLDSEKQRYCNGGYVKCTMLDGQTRLYDYGSYSRFVMVQEVK